MIEQIVNMEMWQIILLTVILLVIMDVIYMNIKLCKQDDETYSPDKKIIKVKYLADIDPIAKTITGDWIDLRCAEDTVLYAGQSKYIPLGVAIKLPEGYEAWVLPRSSTFKIHGLQMANSVGIIDESYCGNGDQWHFPAYATRDCFIRKNERICQFRIIEHQPWSDIEKVMELDAPNRGGIGSSGRM